MAEQTLALAPMAKAWADALAGDAAIEAYCQEKYNASLKVYIGLDMHQPPARADCPLAIVRLGNKLEGADEEQYIYSGSVDWAIANDDKTTAGTITSMDGAAEVDELGQLILACLRTVSANHPITRVEYDIDSVEFFPMHVGTMTLEVTLTPAIGAALIYP